MPEHAGVTWLHAHFSSTCAAARLSWSPLSRIPLFRCPAQRMELLLMRIHDQAAGEEALILRHCAPSARAALARVMLRQAIALALRPRASSPQQGPETQSGNNHAACAWRQTAVPPSLPPRAVRPPLVEPREAAACRGIACSMLMSTAQRIVCPECLCLA